MPRYHTFVTEILLACSAINLKLSFYYVIYSLAIRKRTEAFVFSVSYMIRIQELLEFSMRFWPTDDLYLMGFNLITAFAIWAL